MKTDEEERAEAQAAYDAATPEERAEFEKEIHPASIAQHFVAWRRLRSLEERALLRCAMRRVWEEKHRAARDAEFEAWLREQRPDLVE